MSSYLYTGTSGFGKSYYVENYVLPNFKKIVVFDPTGSFKGDAILYDPTDEIIKKTFHRFRTSGSFKIVIRTSYKGSDKLYFHKALNLAVALGRVIPGLVDEPNRVQLIIDESSTSGIMDEGYFPPEIESLICKGRHVNVDSHWISQNPRSVHVRLREMVIKVVTFFLNSGDAPIFKQKFKRCSDFIPKLPKHYRMEWDLKTGISFFDDKGTKIEPNSIRFQEIFFKESEEEMIFNQISLKKPRKPAKK